VRIRSVLLSTLCVAPVAVAADDEVEKLRGELNAEREARHALERRLDAMESGSRPSDDPLRADVQRYLAERDAAPAEMRRGALGGAGAFVDLSIILDVTAGGSSAAGDTLGSVNLGDHDPRVRGFNARNEELVASADVDPYFHGFLDVVYKLDEEGESAFELEEAYAVTTALPAGLQAKVGQFFTEFGRTNPIHPHAWEFLNYPLVLARVFGGDGWRGQGGRVSWIVPGAPLTLLAGLQNARGETQAPFLGEEGEEVGAHEQQSRAVRSLADLCWHFRAESSRDFLVGGGALTGLLGVSLGVGPNATGPDARTTVWGVDLYWKWRPAATDAGWPFVAWQTEFLFRDLEGAAQTRLVDDGSGGTVPLAVAAQDYDDWGFYTQVVYAFRRPWTAGIRYDHAESDGVFAGSHQRVSVALTYYTSEFSRLRLQMNYDRVAGLPDPDVFSVWLNFSFSLGKHGAHRF